MKITVLDGYSLNPGDNPWDEIAALGSFTAYDRTAPEELIERAKDADILLTNKTVISEQTMELLPNLKYIGVLATGYNIVDVKAAAKRGIPVTNVPTYGTASVAEMVFADILEIARNIRRHADSVAKGEWCANPDYSYWNYPLIELNGKTIGIVGFGAIGRSTGRIAHAFGMRVLAYDKFPGAAPEYDNFAFAQLEDLLRESDFISLHCPLFDDNRGMINNKTLAMMKPTAYLINTARGPLVNEPDLADALEKGVIAGAAVDVLSTEPPKADNPLLNAKNIIVTPHIAWATLEARKRLTAIAAGNIRAFLAGKPINTVK